MKWMSQTLADSAGTVPSPFTEMYLGWKQTKISVCDQFKNHRKMFEPMHKDQILNELSIRFDFKQGYEYSMATHVLWDNLQRPNDQTVL